MLPRDPDNGRRVRRAKPETEWQRADAPHLRIVSDELWEAAQRRRHEIAVSRPRRYAHPKHLLSGLLRCGCCCGGMSKKDNDHGRGRIHCTRMYAAHACDHRRIYYLDEIENFVLGGLREQFGSREAIRVFVKTYNEERQRLACDGTNLRRQLELKLEAVERKINRAVASVIEQRITDEEAETYLRPLRLERKRLLSELVALAPKVVSPRPAMVDAWLDAINHLSEWAARNEDVMQTLRSCVETVTILPTPLGQPPGIKVTGTLAELMTLDPPQDASRVGRNGRAG